LIADATGESALIEFYSGERVVIPAEGPWQAAANFLRAEQEEDQGRCPRYDRIAERLGESGGRLGAKEAMDLLAEVSQRNTQWSVVYHLRGGQVDLSVGRDYERIYRYRFDGTPVE
jgi:hypothetical protein